MLSWILWFFQKERKDIQGEEITKCIFSGQLDDRLDRELLPYFKAFAGVYFWCGNMLPVPSNPSSGMNGVDHWHYKIEHIQQCFEGVFTGPGNKWKNEWNEWIKELRSEKDLKGFITECYLEDCFTEEALKDMNDKNELVKDTTREQKADWLVNNTKFIIQRSYRIENEVTGKWDDEKNNEHKKKVQQIFNVVFTQAGFSGNEYSENLF